MDKAKPKATIEIPPRNVATFATFISARLRIGVTIVGLRRVAACPTYYAATSRRKPWKGISAPTAPPRELFSGFLPLLK
jgi:hypothetical protein